MYFFLTNVITLFVDNLDPLTMTPEELMLFLDIDPVKNEETREKMLKWSPDSEKNPEELGHYFEVR